MPLRQVLQALTKELTVALAMGLLLALAVYLRTLTLGVPINIGLTVGLTAAAIILWAVLAAAALPLILHHASIDPAVVLALLKEFAEKQKAYHQWHSPKLLENTMGYDL